MNIIKTNLEFNSNKTKRNVENIKRNSLKYHLSLQDGLLY